MAEGDACKRCGKPLELKKTVEIGHIFKLGYKYSETMGLRVLNAAGQEVTPIMGSYGIGIERILCAAVELYHDENGMALPPSIAPFQVVVTPVNNADAAQREAAADDLRRAAARWGWTPCWTTATSGPGVKFKDADLIGIPYRITVGKKLAQGKVEVVERGTKQDRRRRRSARRRTSWRTRYPRSMGTELPDASEDLDLVTIFESSETNAQMEAQFIRGVLEAGGVPAHHRGWRRNAEPPL